MRIGDLSRRSQVSVPTIKYYMREGLLPPGTATAANQADYEEAHLQRLRLIRAMIDVGRLSVARVREVLLAVDAAGLAPHDLLGIAHASVTRPARHDPEDPAWREARRTIEEVVRRREWLVAPESTAIDQAAEAVRVMRGLGQDDLLRNLDSYAEAAELIAGREVAAVVARQEPARMVEAVVVGTVLGEALLGAFRLLAQQDASARQLGGPPALRP